MSFILDALRKSEARRRLGQSPDINSVPASSPAAPRRRGGPVMLAIGLIGVAFVSMAVLAYFQQDRLRDTLAGWTGREDAVGSEPAIVSEPISPVPERQGEQPRGELGQSYLPRERIVSDPDQIDTELARMASESDAAEEEAESAPPVVDRRGPLQQEPRSAVVAEAPAQRRRPQVDARQLEQQQQQQRQQRARQRGQPAESTATTRQPTDEAARTESVVAEPATTEPWRPGGAEYVRAWELPLSIRRNLPPLSLTIHVWSAEADQRFVLVNGERFTTGDTIGDGVRLVDIRREGAIVDFRDYRFLLEP